MSMLRLEPYRDPSERLFSMAATGRRAPLGMPMDVYRAGMAATTSRPTCPAWTPAASR